MGTLSYPPGRGNPKLGEGGESGEQSATGCFRRGFSEQQLPIAGDAVHEIQDAVTEGIGQLSFESTGSSFVHQELILASSGKGSDGKTPDSREPVIPGKKYPSSKRRQKVGGATGEGTADPKPPSNRGMPPSPPASSRQNPKANPPSNKEGAPQGTKEVKPPSNRRPRSERRIPVAQNFMTVPSSNEGSPPASSRQNPKASPPSNRGGAPQGTKEVTPPSNRRLRSERKIPVALAALPLVPPLSKPPADLVGSVPVTPRDSCDATANSIRKVMDPQAIASELPPAREGLSSEIPIAAEVVPIPDYIRQVASILTERYNHSIEAVPFLDPTHYIREIRASVVDNKRVNGAYHIQHDSQYLNLIRNQERLSPAEMGQKFYQLDADFYKGYGLTLGNLFSLLGIADNPEQGLRRGDHIANICELGAGNGDILRQLKKIMDLLNVDTTFLGRAEQAPRSQKGAIMAWKSTLTSLVNRAIAGQKKTKPEHGSGQLLALDYADGFIQRLKRAGIKGATADICWDPYHFLKTLELHGVTPNSEDVIYWNMGIDRVDDLHAALQNIRALAVINPDPADKKGFSDFVIGTIYPISSTADSDSKVAGDLTFDFFRRDGDLRDHIMPPQSDQPLTPQEALEQKIESIVKTIQILATYGLIVERIAEQPAHEVFSLHSIVDKAEIIRTQYPELQEREYRDPEHNKLIRQIFARKIPANKIVTIPQVYKVVYFAGKVYNPLPYSEVLETHERERQKGRK